MNAEQKKVLFERINKLEGLLAYAVKNGETDEVERICKDLDRLVESI